MPTVQLSHVVPYRPEQMYELVADVERYPDFLPFCEALRVRRPRTRRTEEVQLLVADMSVGYKALSEHFITRVELDQTALQITATNVGGPFRHLENRWSFRPTRDQSCQIYFYLSYEFRSLMLGSLMGQVLDREVQHLTHAFEKRAAQVLPRTA